MDGERKINISEGVPLNSGAANIFLNTTKTRDSKLNSHDGTVIHLKTEKPSDLGLHINTTFSVASSKKIKLLFVFNFLLSVICMAISCSIAFYYWNEMISMRRQLDGLKDNLLVQNLSNERITQSALVAPRPVAEARRARMDTDLVDDIPQNARKYYVEDFGEDMLLVDSKKKNSNTDTNLVFDAPLKNKELMIAHFNGAKYELNMKSESAIGPWIRDSEVSSKSSIDSIVLNDSTYVTIKEGGLYLIYAQVTYLTKEANVFFIWAGQHEKPRLLATCATGDDSSSRSPAKSQISCSTQVVTRLFAGDKVNLAQREHNRTLWLRSGYSFFGLIKLSS